MWYGGHGVLAVAETGRVSKSINGGRGRSLFSAACKLVAIVTLDLRSFFPSPPHTGERHAVGLSVQPRSPVVLCACVGDPADPACPSPCMQPCCITGRHTDYCNVNVRIRDRVRVSCITIGKVVV